MSDVDFDYRRVDLRAPFSLLRAMIPDLDALVGSGWRSSPLTRAVFHRPGAPDESLSERQGPGDQLRYYTRARVLRGLRCVAIDYSARMPDGVVIRLSALPPEPDRQFVEWLGTFRGVKVEASVGGGADAALAQDRPAAELHDIVAEIRAGSLPAGDISDYLSLLLSFGDSWTARRVADAYLESAEEVDDTLADVLGIPYALQGEVGMARLLWEHRISRSPIEEARSRYSLAMLQARHNPRALLDMEGAEKNLQIAWDRLQDCETGPSVEYERVFNRNGLALLLFRAGDFAGARRLLEDGISVLRKSPYAGQIHHTVLTSNLARVASSAGDARESEGLFRAAIEMDPMFAEYHQDLAAFLGDEGRYDEAVTEAEHAIRLDPSMSEAYRLLGYLLMQTGAALRARDVYSRAAALGDDAALLDMLRASYEAGTPEYTVGCAERVARAELDTRSRAEAELLIAQAGVEMDPGRDVGSVLKDLQDRFPDDELVAAAVRMNADD